ncbi:MAG: T9SS type A sorting domain-containing protein [Prolixibacteraceae bacterium]
MYLRKIFYLGVLSICTILISIIGSAQIVAFPGAEGYGRYASGGRGDASFLDAIVLEVTNLEDYGEGESPVVGSFRWALYQQDTLYNGTLKLKKPATIVFRVGGVIHLKSDIHMATKHLTIAGQTAPGDGICFADGTLNFSGSENLIVRYIRSRPGDTLGEEVSAFRVENGGNFIIDHCSFSWAIEETTHFSSNTNTTVQWCIISESLYNSIHKKGARGYGTQWGGEYASYHHNLLAHHNSRMPRINGSNSNDKEALVDYRNNVNFNWGSAGAFYGGEWEGTSGKGFCHTNVVNNYFKTGPATSGDNFASPSYTRDASIVDGYAKWYFNGNVMEGNESKTNDNWLGVNAGGVGGKDNIYSSVEFVQSDGVLEEYNNYTETADEAFVSVLERVGASLPVRDEHDTRLIGEITGEAAIVRYEYTTDDGQKTPIKGVSLGLIDTQMNLVSSEDRAAGKTAWDVYTTSPLADAPVDTDHDGMPDAWESAHELNPNDYTDFRILTASGYSYLEVYLAELVGDVIDYKTPIGSDGIQLNQRIKLNIYPNPVKDQINIQTDEKIVRVSISDMSGRKVISLQGEQLSETIDVEDLKPGIYVLKATNDAGEVMISKIVKQ